MINKLFLNERVTKIIEIAIALFGLFMIFQILRKILAGSWSIEEVILALLIFNIGCTFTLAIMFSQLRSDHNHLKGQFISLANDFKVHIKKSI